MTATWQKTIVNNLNNNDRMIQLNYETCLRNGLQINVGGWFVRLFEHTSGQTGQTEEGGRGGCM